MQMQSQLFSASGSFVVPSGVNWLWLDGCGGGGGGGNSTPGGGGGGGGAGIPIKHFAVAVTPGSTLTVTVGAVAAGGAVNTDGTAGVDTVIDGLLDAYSTVAGRMVLTAGAGGIAGAAVNGGGGGGNFMAAGGIGGAGNGGVGPANLNIYSTLSQAYFTSGSAGGALNFNGGSFGALSLFYYPDTGAAGGASGGGGGKGGLGPFGVRGNGGAAGFALGLLMAG